MNRLTKLYEVEALLCELSGHLDGKPMSHFRADELLKTSVYDYEADTRYVAPQCTDSCVWGWCFGG